jgi:thiol-disulfide isomerase/thioredoxin
MWSRSFARLVCAGAAIAAAGLLPAAAAQAEPVVGAAVKLPALTLLDGRRLPAGYFQGKPLIVEYWASWCPFCARQNPYVQKLVPLARSKGLEILTVSIDRKESAARDYVRKHAYTFPVTMETPELRGIFGKRKVIPQIFVIKADGKIAEIIPGEMFEEDVLDLIKYAPGKPG